nr:hypothetical protein [Lysobacter enzymogenes]
MSTCTRGALVLSTMLSRGTEAGSARPRRARQRRYRALAGQQVERGGAAEAQGDVAVQAAGVVRIGRGHQRGPVLALVDDQGFAVIGVEVQQRQPAAQADFAGAERIGQPAAVAVAAGPAAAQLPQARPRRVGRAQAGEVGDHDLDAGVAQLLQLRRDPAAVDGVDRVGDQHHGEAGHGALARDQRLGELLAEPAIARFARVLSTEIVEQELVGDDRAAGLADQAQGFVEHLLVAVARALGVGPGQVGQQGDLARAAQRAGDADAGRQRLVDVVDGAGDPGQQEQRERQAQAARATDRGGAWIGVVVEGGGVAHRRGGRDGGPWSGPPAACASSAVRAARSRSASCFLRDGLHSLCGRGLMSLWEGLQARRFSIRPDAFDQA